MAEEEISVRTFSLSAFVFELNGTPDEIAIEVQANYYLQENEIVSEAWLHSTQNGAMMFLADACTFPYTHQSEDEIENYLLEYYHNSDTFLSSVKALLSENYDYFDIDDEKE